MHSTNEYKKGQISMVVYWKQEKIERKYFYCCHIQINFRNIALTFLSKCTSEKRGLSILLNISNLNFYKCKIDETDFKRR